MTIYFMLSEIVLRTGSQGRHSPDNEAWPTDIRLPHNLVSPPLILESACEGANPEDHRYSNPLGQLGFWDGTSPSLGRTRAGERWGQERRSCREPHLLALVNKVYIMLLWVLGNIWVQVHMCILSWAIVSAC